MLLLNLEVLTFLTMAMVQVAEALPVRGEQVLDGVLNHAAPPSSPTSGTVRIFGVNFHQHHEGAGQAISIAHFPTIAPPAMTPAQHVASLSTSGSARPFGVELHQHHEGAAGQASGAHIPTAIPPSAMTPAQHVTSASAHHLSPPLPLPHPRVDPPPILATSGPTPVPLQVGGSSGGRPLAGEATVISQGRGRGKRVGTSGEATVTSQGTRRRKVLFPPADVPLTPLQQRHANLKQKKALAMKKSRARKKSATKQPEEQLVENPLREGPGAAGTSEMEEIPVEQMTTTTTTTTTTPPKKKRVRTQKSRVSEAKRKHRYHEAKMRMLEEQYKAQMAAMGSSETSKTGDAVAAASARGGAGPSDPQP